MTEDYEHKQRKDDLARELLGSGAASSRADAEQRAEEILLQEKKSDDATKKNLQKDAGHATRKDLMDVVRNQQKIFDEISKLAAKINLLAYDINMIKSSIQGKLPAKREESPPKEAPPKQNPRSGEYSPEDVAIEKVFYCGQKE